MDWSDAEGARRRLAEATTLPPRFYLDGDVFAAEQEAVLARSWLPVCREEDVAEPGDYVATSLAGDPVVVVRDKAGALRALANVCRHRNTTVVEGRGRAKALQCPYHLWTYGLDGHLVAAPDMREAVGFDPATVCLPELRLDRWQGWVFVNLDDEAAPLGPQLSGLDAICAPHDLASMRRIGALEFPSPWNWKVMVENFAESYHHAGTHPKTLHTTFPGNRSWCEHVEGEPWISLDHVSTVEGIEPFTATVVFPYHLFSIIRPVGMLWFRMDVAAVDHHDLVIEVFLRPEHVGDEAIERLMLDTAAEVNLEDVEVNRRTQDGLRSRRAAPGRISPLEEGTWHFRRWLLDRLDRR